MTIKINADSCYLLIMVTPWKNPIDNLIYSFLPKFNEESEDADLSIIDIKSGKKFISKYKIYDADNKVKLIFTTFEFEIIEINKEVTPALMFLKDLKGTPVHFQSVSLLH